MKFSSFIKNTPGEHQIRLKIGEKEQTIPIVPKPTGGQTFQTLSFFFLRLLLVLQRYLS